MTNNFPETTKEKPLTKIEKCIGYLFQNYSIQEAGRMAGFSESTIEKSLYSVLKQPQNQDRIKAHRVNNSIINLPQIARINSKVLDLAEENPEDIPKYRHTLESEQRIAGILNDQPIGKQTINITDARQLMIQINKGLDADNPQHIEGEVVDE